MDADTPIYNQLTAERGDPQDNTRPEVGEDR